MTSYASLDPLRLPLIGIQLIEASAGTGKTWTLASLYLRLVLGHGLDKPLLPPQILVMTFTKAATAELRERIHARLVEAVQAFRGRRETTDEFLTVLMADYPDDEQRKRAARELELAAQWMDEAAIFTIHGWCQRMLTQHAFTSATPTISDVLSGQTDLLTEVVCDYWRCHVFSLSPGATLLYHNTLGDTPDALQAAIKAPLDHVNDLQIKGHSITPEGPEIVLEPLAEKKQAATQHIQSLWRAQRNTIVQLLTGAMENGSLGKNIYKPATLSADHTAFDRWVTCDEQPADKKTMERHSSTKLASATTKKGTTPRHAFFTAIDAWLEIDNTKQTFKPLLIAHAALWVAQRMDEARRQRATLSFDDMLTRLDAALRGNNSAVLARLIGHQYPVALIDEFQDTDPLQWRILGRIYVPVKSSMLLLIGDPKQAIYSFRGADIHTYLAARDQAAKPHWTLDTNYRATRSLVEAINHLFSFASQHVKGAFGFGHELPFLKVKARSRCEHLQLDGVPLTGMHIAFATPDKPPAKDGYRELMARHAAAQIAFWLAKAKRECCGFVHQEKPLTALKSSDLAILVRDKIEATAMRKALRAYDLDHVYLSDRQSVYASDEAVDLEYWLVACADPGNKNALCTALATPTMGYRLTELARLHNDETYWASYYQKFHQLHQKWRSQGVLAMIRELLHRFDIARSLLARPDGERALTNLLQLAELLQQASDRDQLNSLHALIRYLATQIRESTADQPPEEQLVRLESEAALIKVVTIHQSKGLEYPVVLLPFVGLCNPVNQKVNDKTNKPLLWHDEQKNLHFELNPDPKVREQAETERLQEDIRLLYVALTRAQHLCWLGLACPKNGLHASALGYVLSGGDAITPATLAACLKSFAANQSVIRIDALPPISHEADVRPIKIRTDRSREARRCTLTPAIPWRIDSYSALCPGESELTSIPSPTIHSTTPDIHAFERGATAGIFLHNLLQWCAEKGFKQVTALSQELCNTIDQRCQAQGWQGWRSWATMLKQWLPDLLRTPLPLSGGEETALNALVDLHHYRAELEFWFEAHQVSTSVLDRLITDSTLDGIPRPALHVRQVNGMLHGFMDLVFEHAGRWYVADYKSNYLGPDTCSYNAKSMRESIRHKRYDLQYALYTLALHRQLRARLSDYNYNAHMGGVLCLYLRGIVGGDDGQGIYAERLPQSVVETMDTLFTHGNDPDTA